MPRRDGTGPMGQGSMTGRGAGPCSGDVAQGAPGQGRGRGFGLGFGRGFGRGGGAGFGRGWQWWRRGAVAGAAVPPAAVAAAAREEEALRMRIDALKEELACLEKGVRAMKGDADKG